MKRFLQTLSIFYILSLQAAGASPISLRVTPQVIFSYTDSPIIITVSIDPHKNNRVGSIEIVSEDYYTGSEFPVPGLEARKIYRFERFVRVAGTYEVVARVKRVDGDIFTARANLVVTAGEPQSSR